MIFSLSPFVFALVNMIITFFFCGYFMCKNPVPIPEISFIYFGEGIISLGIWIFTYQRQKQVIEESELKDNIDIEDNTPQPSDDSKITKQFSEKFLLYVIIFSVIGPVLLIFGGLLLYFQTFIYEIGALSMIVSFLLILSVCLYIGNDINYFFQKLFIGRV